MMPKNTHVKPTSFPGLSPIRPTERESRFWETRDQRFPGSLSLSLARSVGRQVGKNPGNEFDVKLVGCLFTIHYLRDFRK